MRKFCIIIFVILLLFLLYKITNIPEILNEITQGPKTHRQSKEKSLNYGVKYYKAGKASEYTILNKNGTYKIREDCKVYIGNYEIHDNKITFKKLEKMGTATFKAGVIIDSEGNKWQQIIKQ